MKKASSFWKKLLPALLLALELTVITDLILAIAGCSLPRVGFYGLFTVLLLLPLLLHGLSARTLLRLGRSLLVLGLILLLAAGTFLALFARKGAYAEVDEGKAALYGGQHVLVIAPHEDDEINIAGGVIEEYRRYGSTVTLLFVTNGDYMGKGETRMREALQVAARLGVPEEQVIFLGYGDGWITEEGFHLYNAPEGMDLLSMGLHRETYGLPEHPAFREGRSYTREHLLEDLGEAIRLLHPDVIFCSDYENHADHIAVSLFTEEALCRLLRAEPGYRPLVLKSFCYNTSYYGSGDFYAANILSTRDPGDIWYCRWEDRLRLPVSAATLSRSMLSSSSYWELRAHATQGASLFAENIINGDRVFWLRDTENLLLRGQALASSGDAAVLNDFKLRDSRNIAQVGIAQDGVWIPEARDDEREAQLILPQETALRCIRLYDNPSPDDNVLDALLLLDDGTELHTGPLDPHGAPTELALDGPVTGTIRLRLLDTEGARAGLTEVEADGAARSRLPRYIKLMDEEENFVYDYYVVPRGWQTFRLYAPYDAPLSEADYRLQLNGVDCEAEIRDGELLVSCPPGASCTLTVSTADGVCADTVRLSNPGPFLRGQAQQIERTLRLWWDRRLPDSNAFLLVRDIYRLARYGSTANA